jgi:hypothetical protein
VDDVKAVIKIKDYLMIKDNFFNEKIYNEILFDISQCLFMNRDTTVEKESQNIYQKIYFNYSLDFNHFAVKEMKNILKNMGLNTKSYDHNYMLSTKHVEATPHRDIPNDINCLIYLKGDQLMNSGTGFYDKVNKDYILHSHIGFKENRAIIFDPKIYHCSLQFEKNCGPRYVMANFLNYEE